MLNPDIIYVIETKLKGEAKITFKGYTWHGLNRKKVRVRGNWYFCMYKDWLFGVIDTSIDGILMATFQVENNSSQASFMSYE